MTVPASGVELVNHALWLGAACLILGIFLVTFLAILVVAYHSWRHQLRPVTQESVARELPERSKWRWQFSLRLTLLVVTWIAANIAIVRFLLSSDADDTFRFDVLLMLGFVNELVLVVLIGLFGNARTVRHRRRVLALFILVLVGSAAALFTRFMLSLALYSI